MPLLHLHMVTFRDLLLDPLPFGSLIEVQATMCDVTGGAGRFLFWARELAIAVLKVVSESIWPF